MCTAVIDVMSSGVRLLCVRDEDPARAWDDLGPWWPDTHPGVIGIRDRRAGGAWLAFDPETKRLAVLLNRADVIDLPDHEVRSRGALVLDSIAGHSPVAPRTHGFNLLEATPSGARIVSWDGVTLRETPVDPGVHMIAHDDLDDPATARITAWLPRFRTLEDDDEPWPESWIALLQDTAAIPSTDDRAIIRDNRTHGYDTLSLLYCTAELTDADIEVSSTVLDRPGHL
ncbi:NRDE family protein [Microbacterium gorillae]|uniref:NRDE family protein n=1 Tax=Microbacterium gorillae TaxID=1231063 RepID=UPI00058AF570|nr:NRDE family protein [Microbacterium gorillae]